MNTSTKIAMAVAGGYVLGRRRKVKMALLLGSVLVGRRFDLRSLGREAMGRIAGSPAVGQIRDEIKGDLASTSRAAATAVLSAPLEKLADRLHEHTAGLNGENGDGDGRTDGKARGESAADEGEEQADEGQDQQQGDRRERRRPERDEDEESPRRRRAPSRTGSGRTARRGERTGTRRVPTRAGSRGSGR